MIKRIVSSDLGSRPAPSGIRRRRSRYHRHFRIQIQLFWEFDRF